MASADAAPAAAASTASQGGIAGFWGGITNSLPDASALTNNLPDTSALTKNFPDTSALTNNFPDTSALTKNFPDTSAMTRNLPDTSTMTAGLVGGAAGAAAVTTGLVGSAAGALPGVQSVTEVAADGSESEVFYLNILVVKIDGMREQAQAKVAHITNPLGFGVLQGISKDVVGRMVTEDVVAKKLAGKMPKELPYKMADMGIKARAEAIYQHGSYIVLKVYIDSVNAEEVMQKKLGSAAGLFACCMGPSADGLMKKKLGAKMVETMPAKLATQMQEKGLTVEVVGKTQATQKEFQDHTIQQLPDHGGSEHPWRNHCTMPECSVQ